MLATAAESVTTFTRKRPCKKAATTHACAPNNRGDNYYMAPIVHHSPIVSILGTMISIYKHIHIFHTLVITFTLAIPTN